MIDILSVSDDLKINENKENYKINENKENYDDEQGYSIIMSGNLYKGDRLISADVAGNSRLMYTSSTDNSKYIGCYWSTDGMIYTKMNSSCLFRIRASLFDTRLHGCESADKHEL